MEQQFFAGDSTKAISKENLLAAFISILNDQEGPIAKEDAMKIQQQFMDKQREEQMKRQQEEMEKRQAEYLEQLDKENSEKFAANREAGVKFLNENKNKEVAKKVKASQLTPSGDPNDKTSCEYRIIVKAKSGSGYAGKTEIAKEYYTVSYYKAKRNVVKAGIPVEKAKTGKKLSAPPTAAGSYVMVIKGKKPYYGTEYILFDIQDKISNTTIAKVKRQKYTGKAVTPKLTVKYRGTTLKEGVDYTVTYKNNVKAGTATATIKGCSKVWAFEPPKSIDDDFVVEKDKQRFFSGSRSVTFEIAK